MSASLPLARSSSISSTSLWMSSVPRRKKSKKQRSSSTASKHGPPHIALNDEDLKEHVMFEYVYGRGGMLRDVETRRKKQAESAISQRKKSKQGTGDGKHGERHSKNKEEEEEMENLEKHLKKLDQHPALILNADYQPISYLPLSMWHWQESIKAIFTGKVTVVDVYPDVTIRAVNVQIPLPSVIALIDYAPQPNSIPAFTKRNVFLRDEYRCQYCSHRFHTRDLSLDHVTPRCMGGRLNWMNAVTCCRKCNCKKGSLSVKQLKQVGMQLLREPHTPNQYQLHKAAGKLLPRKVHPTWRPYLRTWSSDDEDKEDDNTATGEAVAVADSKQKNSRQRKKQQDDEGAFFQMMP